MENQNEMYHVSNHPALKHLAIPYFYFVPKEKFTDSSDFEFIKSNKTITDDLFNVLLKSNHNNQQEIKSNVSKKTKSYTKKHNKNKKRYTRKLN